MVAEVNPKQAWNILREKPTAILLDVRSKVEFDYVGHPVDAVHVPIQEAPDWQTDPDFVQKVIERLGESSRDITILTICRSGKRSMLAAQLLEAQGYTHTANIAEGFEGDLDENRHRGNVNGWRFHGLPWEQT
ncbi:MAG: rhodanese-like domain-containing protein [Gammaproteobacteria bacterium]|nr:rhodanese-like domain-containing protein [Gammaproteobacteria bacterium]MDE0513398.1 rhodanese-like domain-containing protein [Gammaproteobacteria bacterium]